MPARQVKEGSPAGASDRTLVAILALAFVLRVVGVTFGSPAAVHPDEAQYMPRAMGMIADRTIVPGDYHNTHLLTNLCGAIVAGAFPVLRLAGVVSDVKAYGTFAWSHTFLFLVLARVLSVLAGTATVAVTYSLARLVGSRRSALIAAGLLAVSYLAVRDSHFATNDVLMTLWLTAAAVQALRYADRQHLGPAVLSGLLAGLAIGTKWTGVVAVMPIAAAVLWVAWRRRSPTVVWRHGLAAALATVAAFVLSNPAVLVAPVPVFHGFAQARAVSQVPWLGQAPGPVAWLAVKAIWVGIGGGAVLAAVWGALRLVRIQGSRFAITISGAVVYALSLAAAHAFGARLVIPLLPVIAALAGVGAADLLDRLHPLAGRRRVAFTAVLLSAMFLPTLAKAAYLDFLLTRTDSRRDVESWLQNHPEVMRSLAIDASTTAGFAGPPPQGARVIQISQLGRGTPDGLVGAGTAFVALSATTAFPEVSALWHWSAAHGTLLFESTPFDGPHALPEADDVYAPFADVFHWRRPGTVVRVFRLNQPVGGTAR